jgi:hypothetical protein
MCSKFVFKFNLCRYPEPPVEGPDARGNPSEQCMNMRLLMRQHKHICLGGALYVISS